MSNDADWGTLRLTNADHIELETTLQQLLLNLRRDAVKTNVAPGEDSILLVLLIRRRHCVLRAM